MPTRFFKPGDQARLDRAPSSPDPDILVRVDVGPDTAHRSESVPVRLEWEYKQHLYTNKSGVNRYAGAGLYIDTDILDASYSNPVPITTYEGEVLDEDATRTDSYDFMPTTSWAVGH